MSKRLKHYATTLTVERALLPISACQLTREDLTKRKADVTCTRCLSYLANKQKKGKP